MKLLKDKTHVVDAEFPGLIVASCNLFRPNPEETAARIVEAWNSLDGLKEEKEKLSFQLGQSIEEIHRLQDNEKWLLDEYEKRTNEIERLKEQVNHFAITLGKIRDRTVCLDKGVNNTGNTQIYDVWQLAYNGIEKYSPYKQKTN